MALKRTETLGMDKLPVYWLELRFEKQKMAVPQVHERHREKHTAQSTGGTAEHLPEAVQDEPAVETVQCPCCNIELRKGPGRGNLIRYVPAHRGIDLSFCSPIGSESAACSVQSCKAGPVDTCLPFQRLWRQAVLHPRVTPSRVTSSVQCVLLV